MLMHVDVAVVKDVDQSLIVGVKRIRIEGLSARWVAPAGSVPGAVAALSG